MRHPSLLLSLMARCDPWACWAQWWQPADVEAQLRNQLEVHDARLRAVDAEITGIELAKVAAARAGRTDAARACILDRRKREAQRLKYVQLRDFCQSTLDRVADMSTVRNTVSAIEAVRKTYGNVDTVERLYEKFGASVQDLAHTGEALEDMHAIMAPRADGTDDEELAAELAALMAGALEEAPPPPSALKPPPHQKVTSAYAAMGIEVV